MRRIIAGSVFGLVLLTQVAPSWADSTGAEVAAGTGSVIGSAVYFPFKASFCILGGIGSGIAYGIGGPAAARRTVDSACRGTWAITPNVVKGREPVHFVGTSPRPVPPPPPVAYYPPPPR